MGGGIPREKTQEGNGKQEQRDKRQENIKGYGSGHIGAVITGKSL
jgi:hypothetical protein